MGTSPITGTRRRGGHVILDNQGCIEFAKHPLDHNRTKHIDIRYHFIRDHIEQKTITLVYTTTDTNISYVLTKALPGPRHTTHLYKMGLQPILPSYCRSSRRRRRRRTRRRRRRTGRRRWTRIAREGIRNSGFAPMTTLRRPTTMPPLNCKLQLPVLTRQEDVVPSVVDRVPCLLDPCQDLGRSGVGRKRKRHRQMLDDGTDGVQVLIVVRQLLLRRVNGMLGKGSGKVKPRILRPRTCQMQVTRRPVNKTSRPPRC